MKGAIGAMGSVHSYPRYSFPFAFGSDAGCNVHETACARTYVMLSGERGHVKTNTGQ